MQQVIIGQSVDGQAIQQIVLQNASMKVSVLTLGATIQSIYLAGFEHSLVLGASDLAAYYQDAEYFGAVVGRVANRLAKGNLYVAGQAYTLPLTPPGPHHLHGGPVGTHARNWQVVERGDDFVLLRLTLEDGEMGYPGRLSIELYYRLLDSTLEMDIMAVAEQTTVCNLAGHSYFNLDGRGDVLQHQLYVQADSYLPVDTTGLPLGEVCTVEGTAFDFRQVRRIGGEGFIGLDHNFCLSTQRTGLREVARLIAPVTGLQLVCATTEPGLQVYDGRHIRLDDARSINKCPLGAYAGLALEAQLWPDAVHHKGFPTIELPAGQRYRQITQYRFR